MGTMKTFNPDDWTPVTLVAPDGRTYTPGDHIEHRQLLTQGYTVAPAAQDAPTSPSTAPVTAQAPAAETSPSDAEASENKPKTTRRNGGQ
ncbi:hypothetical protein ABH922_002796 [Rhodococcus sp. 27YEA15]|uniref:hypothetical protein n=1 Tax=Rhodococcus sp. 27YEA15 TaxID=3156259 RepID=UPI003C7B1A03